MNFLQHHVCPEVISLEEIQDKTKNDIALQKVISKMQNQREEINIENKELKVLLNLIPELILTPDEILLKQDRIVIPDELQHRVIKLVHENHLGIAKTIVLLSEKTYFVNMEAKVKAKISECILCAAVSKSPTPQPLEPSTLPPYPWHTINIGFLGPLPSSKYLLVAVDQYSRCPVDEIISSTSANCTISRLEKIFSEHGLPQRIISDNGPPFKSSQISTNMKNSRITHNRISPLYPRANGIVENFMRNLNKILHIANMQKRNWKSALYNYLLAYRVSPNMSTKVPPALLLNNKIPKTKIPAVNHEIDAGVHQKLEAHDKIMKDKMKKYFGNRYQTKNRQIHMRDRALVK